MSKFRKKPVTIEAVQITDATFDMPHPNPEHIAGLVYDSVRRQVRIKTPEGIMTGILGDWIITGVKGEHYPCKPDIFAVTYDPPQFIAPDGSISASSTSLPARMFPLKLTSQKPQGDPS